MICILHKGGCFIGLYLFDYVLAISGIKFDRPCVCYYFEDEDLFLYLLL